MLSAPVPRVRPPAVAGTFYPADPTQLQALLDHCHAARVPLQVPPPKAVIAPHAGYVYSGPVAATAYATLAPLRGRIERVVLLGPSHRVPLRGCAVPEAEVWQTPLGPIEIDREGVQRLAALPEVVRSDRPHAAEHSLEVHLPFLQRVLGQFRLLPVVVGPIDAQAGARLLEAVWGGPETLVVVSTDLSHFLDDRTAKLVDAQTSAAIERLDVAALDPERACGAFPVRVLLATARNKGLQIKTVDLRTSADTAGDPARVVGYGAWLLWPSAPGHADDQPGTTGENADATPAVPERRFDAAQRKLLTELAWQAIHLGLERGRPRSLDLDLPAHDWLHRPAACFVTLKQDGELRGCIGNLEPRGPLGRAVVSNALGAAFADPRFAPVHRGEVHGLDLSISVLGDLRPLAVTDHAELLRRLRPGVDGLVVRAGLHGATFLPAVWGQLPEPRAFVSALWRKAGLRHEAWPAGIQLSIYSTEAWDGLGQDVAE